MSDAEILDLVGRAAVNGYQVDLGQFDKAQKRELDRLVKRGALVKARLCWPWLTHGTCTKTFYINVSSEARP